MKNILWSIFWLSVFSVGARGTPYKPENEYGLYYPCESTPDLYAEDGLPAWRPLILAHRGASGMYPEHTALAYKNAAIQGADVIECDLAITKDHKFICSHEPWLSWTTNIADHFPARNKTYNMDDDDPNVDWNDKGNISDWFSFDFTLAELKTLKKIQPNEFRDPKYDGQERVVTLEELVDITREYGEKQKRTIGIYPELKHSHAVNKILAERGDAKKFEDYALEELNRLGYNSSTDPCYLQAFEMSSLEYVKNKTDLKLVFLLEQNITGNTAVWERLDTIGLAGMGIDKGNLVTPGCADDSGRGNYECGTTDFIQEVKTHGLKVHAFTFRNEWMKLYWDHGQDPYSQLEEFHKLGLDGYFSDFPLTIRRFLHYKGELCGGLASSTNPLSAKTIIFLIISFVTLHCL